jgi:lantibiotic modifying enzyme
LSRLRMLAHLDETPLLASIRTAAATTMNRGFGSNHSLCHGDLGNLMFLQEASRTLRDDGLRAAVEELTSYVLTSISATGFLCGVPFTVESPGLMEGLAGIGYGLLRLAAPEQVPCVLLLDSRRA